ncbi:mediator of RNA polymerase II transcription subunit 32-like [Amaranthus tricolor]|uniref:mediator of RNA polymerase II transcription subunit 32-like n=1 Tax=Amaranthus tricolor TaxID=29722 RepID=UPI0025865CDE|nr:mediator of RNA polymerase II transcription subunit 32-like [Amaranthus tricolor]
MHNPRIPCPASCTQPLQGYLSRLHKIVESVKKRIGSECLVDEATGSVAGKPGQPVASLPPISAVRLVQMSKAVRWLVIELPQGSGNNGGSSHLNPSTPFDARFSEDTTQ